MPGTKTNGGCPKCDGDMWDNRLDKKNPKSPDFKCANKTCDGVIWPPKPGQQPPAPFAQAKQPVELGAHIPGLDDGAPLPTPPEDAVVSPALDKLNALFQLYGVCYEEAARIAGKHAKLVPDVSAMAATLFIAANQRGVTV